MYTIDLSKVKNHRFLGHLCFDLTCLSFGVSTKVTGNSGISYYSRCISQILNALKTNQALLYLIAHLLLTVFE